MASLLPSTGYRSATVTENSQRNETPFSPVERQLIIAEFKKKTMLSNNAIIYMATTAHDKAVDLVHPRCWHLEHRRNIRNSKPITDMENFNIPF